MKRIEQLQLLSKEHHQSLTLGQKAIKISQQGDQDAIAELCLKIVSEYSTVWKIHFKIEEDSIFTPYANRSPDIEQMCQQLSHEHQLLDDYYQQMKLGDYGVLEAFGSLLKQHTRTEERQLFPLLESVLTPEELDRVYQTSCNYRNN